MPARTDWYRHTPVPDHIICLSQSILPLGCAPGAPWFLALIVYLLHAHILSTIAQHSSSPSHCKQARHTTPALSILRRLPATNISAGLVLARPAASLTVTLFPSWCHYIHSLDWRRRRYVRVFGHRYSVKTAEEAVGTDIVELR